MKGPVRLLGARALGALALAALLAAPAPAFAADDAHIDHSEFTGDTLKMLVSVPGDAPVDLDSVTVRIGDEDVTASAEPADENSDIRRTTILAIDTSNSMRGGNIAAAKAAARAYLDLVPANVEVGIVSFNSVVTREQAPSTDRAASAAVLDRLQLANKTRLYEGVAEAAAATGNHDGLRQVLVLSDGEIGVVGSVKTALDAIRKTGVTVDAVSLDPEGDVPAPLAEMAAAGKGQVIKADTDTLRAAYQREAAVLARQIVVTAEIPVGSETSADVAVSLTAGEDEHTSKAFLAIRDAETKAPELPKAPTKRDYNVVVPKEAVYGGLAAIFLGVIGLAFAFSSGRSPRLGVAEQIAAYGTGADRKKLLSKQAAPAESLKESAKAAAESVLASNKSLEARIANRLEGAGMSLKPPEWILMHAGVFLAFTLIGLLAGGGTNIPLLIMFLFMGALGPWLYLSLRRSRRLKAFSESLPETLQLMSGSLSAGLSLAQSLDTIVREGTEPMTGEFKRVIAETRLGVGLEDAMEGVAERMNSKDFRWVIMAIRIQREVGGNLAELLLTVAATLREREYLRRQVRALSAEGRLSAYILGGLPPVFLLYLTATKPDYVHPMYSDPRGWVMLGVLAVLLVAGFFWMMKVAKVEV